MTATFYEINATFTAKPIRPKSTRHIYDQKKIQLPTIAAVREWIADNLPAKCKREKIFIDDINRNAQHIGYIYSFKNRDLSHHSEWWWEQVWLDVRQLTSQRLSPQKWISQN